MHCYRMLGSVLDAEDLVQETLLRAWRVTNHVSGAGVAADVAVSHRDECLPDRTRRVGRAACSQRTSARPPSEVAWLEPYPDRLLDDLWRTRRPVPRRCTTSARRPSSRSSRRCSICRHVSGRCC